METHKKITVTGVLSEGIGLGIKNAVSMLGATVLWLLTIWIPYLNVGTTIAMNTIPIELSKGKVISPLFIFDGKYRKYMGEYFTLNRFDVPCHYSRLVFHDYTGDHHIHRLVARNLHLTR